MKVPFEDLSLLNATYLPALTAALEQVAMHQNLILGDAVTVFEQALAASTNREHAIGLSSGTAALSLTLKALSRNDHRKEVVIPALTCFPVVAAALEAGLSPVFADVDAHRWLLSPAAASLACTSNTLAVIAVHLYGQICDMQPLKAVCDTHNVYLVEDCAQAQGAYYHGKPAGSFGIAAAFSFYPTKILGALGDAGAVICDDAELAEQIRNQRTYGSQARGPYAQSGINARMDTIQAAFLNVKWQSLPLILQHKRMLAEVYRKQLPDNLTMPQIPEYVEDTPHLFPVLAADRDAVRAKLLEAGIGTMIHYGTIPPLEPLFSQKYKPEEFPIAAAVSNAVISLPFSAIHTRDQILHVCDTLRHHYPA